MTAKMPAGRREEVVTRDNYQCQAPAWDAQHSRADCDTPLTVHHRRPKGMGGTSDDTIHDVDNLVLLCNFHHQGVHANPTRSYVSGLLQRKKL